MEIILIRHAQSKGNKQNIVQGHSDQGLSDLGKEQANQFAKSFNKDINAIYSSDTGRAVETATPLAEKLGLKIHTDSELREANFGKWEGLTYDEVKKLYPLEYESWHKNYHIRPEWFESFESHFLRIKSAISKVLANHNLNDRIAIFTHGGSIKTQIGHFNNLSGEELTNFTNSNCSMTLLRFNPSKDYEHGKTVYYNRDIINTAAQKEL